MCSISLLLLMFAVSISLELSMAAKLGFFCGSTVTLFWVSGKEIARGDEEDDHWAHLRVCTSFEDGYGQANSLTVTY